jgi:hypothetical protein
MGLSVAFNLLKSGLLMTVPSLGRCASSPLRGAARRLARLTSLCALLLGLTAFAQTTTTPVAITIAESLHPNLDTFTFGAADCATPISIQWTNTLLINLTSCGANPLKMWVTAGECRDEIGLNDSALEDIDAVTLNTVRQGRFNVTPIKDFPDFKTTTTTDGGTLQQCGSMEPFTKQHRICGSVAYKLNSGFGCTGDNTFQTATSLKVVYDSEPPSAPTITDYAAQDEAVKVGFTVDSDTSVVLLEVMGGKYTDFTQIKDGSASNSSIKGDGLENNVMYQVRLRARDAAGNTSEPSPEISATPIKTLGFYGYYKDLGGTDQGCSVGMGLMPLLLTAFALRRLRRKS